MTVRFVARLASNIFPHRHFSLVSNVDESLFDTPVYAALKKVYDNGILVPDVSLFQVSPRLAHLWTSKQKMTTELIANKQIRKDFITGVHHGDRLQFRIQEVIDSKLHFKMYH